MNILDKLKKVFAKSEEKENGRSRSKLKENDAVIRIDIKHRQYTLWLNKSIAREIRERGLLYWDDRINPITKELDLRFLSEPQNKADKKKKIYTKGLEGSSIKISSKELVKDICAILDIGKPDKDIRQKIFISNNISHFREINKGVQIAVVRISKNLRTYKQTLL